MIQTQFIRQQYKDGTHVDSKMLSNALLTEPHVYHTLVYAFANEKVGTFGDGYGVLQYLTQGSGAIAEIGIDYEGIGNSEIKWPLMGRLGRPIPIGGAAEPIISGAVGRNFSEFIVPLTEKYFGVGDVCRFPNGSQARVQEEPYRSGNNWCYKFVIIGNEPNESIPSSELVVGAEISQLYNAFEEKSHGGNTKFTTPMWYRNQMTTVRKSFEITGDANTDVVVLKFTRDGKAGYLWMFEYYYQFMKQWFHEVENMLWWGKYNRLADGTIPINGASGKPVIMGAGIEEQVSQANHIVSSRLEEDMLYNMLVEIGRSKGGEAVQRTLITGNGGTREFHDAMKRAGLEFTTVDTNFVHKKTGNQLAFGAQYTTYKGFGGSSFTLIQHPAFDDPNVDASRVGPWGYSRTSYKMFFIDFGMYNGKPNLQIIPKASPNDNRMMKQWVTGGSFLPGSNGEGTNVKDLSAKQLQGLPMRSHDGDYASVHCLSQLMIKICNPLSCGLIEINPPSVG
jgi:hypothetical protein